MGAFRCLSRARIAILRYHSVRECPADYRYTIGHGIIHEAIEFERQMRIVAGAFVPVTMDQVRAYVTGTEKLPRRAVAVTFDDGYSDNYEIAAPIMERVGVPGAFYLTVAPVETGIPPWFVRLRYAFFRSRVGNWTSSSDGRQFTFVSEQDRRAAFIHACRFVATLSGDEQHIYVAGIETTLEASILECVSGVMMSWAQARHLCARGHTVGSHTLTHPNLAHVGAEEVLRELTVSKQRMETELGIPVVHLSYPAPILDPHWNERTVQLSEEAGYRSAVTCMSGLVRVGDAPLRLHRVFAPQDTAEFRWRLESGFVGLGGR